MKILLAYDGGDAAKRALELAEELTEKFDAELGVVSVIPYHPGRSPIDPTDDPAVHRAQLAEAKQILEGRGIEPVLFERAGDPGPAIEHVAEAGGYDLIVVGSRGLGALSRFLQGSVSEHVATHATATVVIAR